MTAFIAVLGIRLRRGSRRCHSQDDKPIGLVFVLHQSTVYELMLLACCPYPHLLLCNSIGDENLQVYISCEGEIARTILYLSSMYAIDSSQ